MIAFGKLLPRSTDKKLERIFQLLLPFSYTESKRRMHQSHKMGLICFVLSQSYLRSAGEGKGWKAIASYVAPLTVIFPAYRTKTSEYILKQFFLFLSFFSKSHCCFIQLMEKMGSYLTSNGQRITAVIDYCALRDDNCIWVIREN